MKPLTYLGFTIFSVFMQFCVMEFIYEKLHDDKELISLNETAQKNNIIKEINRKPHALFYRKNIDQQTSEARSYAHFVKYSNSSLEDMSFSTSTDVSTGTFDVFYDENTSVTDLYITTESDFTDSDFDNVTQITLLDKSRSTTSTPSQKKKERNKAKCFCDLLYKKCDINCCCDEECTEEERSMFLNCIQNGRHSYPTCRNTISASNELNDLFCIVAVNLSKKTVKSNFKFDVASINATFKWNSIEKPDVKLNYKKKKYEYGDSVWFIQNNSIFSMYLPTTLTNNYCSGRKNIKFLINENIKCNVKLEDLYVFSVLKTLEGSKLISVTESTLNKTALNCSSLHCTNWTIFACDELSCSDFNKSMRAPKCTEKYCHNLPLKLEYTFYYFESRITNASLKLYMKNMSTNTPFLTQEVDVRWYLGNESIEDIVQLSGNPGYIRGLPIIVSSAAHNHSKNFYNVTLGKNLLSLPHNENGKCIWSVHSNKTVEFGFNTRSKCRLKLKQNISSGNATNACLRIQMNIKESLRIHRKLFVSPYGNPRHVSDENWVPIEVDDRSFLYGEYHTNGSKLNCYNLATRYAIVIVYVDKSGEMNRQENKIVKATVGVTTFNITFDATDLSIVLTADIRFVDISKPINVYDAMASPLDVHLPANFFDVPSNECYNLDNDIVWVPFTTLILIILNK